MDSGDNQERRANPIVTKLTRRNLFATAAVAAAAVAPLPAQTTASKDEDLKSARDTIANNSAQLAKIEIPIATEPAFSFRAQ